MFNDVDGRGRVRNEGFSNRLRRFVVLFITAYESTKIGFGFF